MKMIIMSTEDLAGMLDACKRYKDYIIYDSDDNTDGEGVWHCDVEFTDDIHDSHYDTAEEVWSFNEY